MGRTILRRFLLALIALLAILYLSALGLSMARGAPFGPALKEATAHSADYLWALLHGDLGVSTSRQREPLPAGQVIAATLSKSLLLLGLALTIAAVLGILLGGVAARRRRSPLALPILLSSLLGTSIPSFLLALALQIAAIRFYQKTGVRLVSMGGFKQSALWLPAIVLAARPFAQITRVTFFSISEALEQDYVRTALGKGVPRRDLFRRHVYRNVAIPILTTLVTSIRFTLISLPVVEFFFSYPGAGEALLRGIRRQDDALVFGLLLALGLLFIAANALLELLYRLVDPRLHSGGDQEKQRLTQLHPGVGAALSELGHSFLDSGPIFFLRRLFRRQRPTESSTFSQVLHQRALEQGGEELGSLHRRERRLAWLRGTLQNPPLLLGLLLLVPLLLLVLSGSFLAPHNPYNTIGLRIVEGRIQAPPFPPGPEFLLGTDVLGRDIWSLLLVGAQQTLIIATIVMLARLALGSTLGLLAGWFEGSWLDRAISNLIEIIAAFPTLLCAMVLILAMGIRQGVPTFVVALCFVGWGEVAQFVRGQVVSLKPRPFVEAAVVTGGRWPEILTRHILPNLLSPLVAIAALEMGAVLMLLGELGFVGIFIGGGAFAEVVVFGPPYYYSDVPEWAALLANIRGYARSYPWMAWPPAIAFAITILAFNLTGEGILRLIERVGASFTRLLNRYTALAGVAFIALMLVVRAQTGPLAFYRPLANTFSGERALEHVRALTAPEMAGRRVGTAGADLAAEYIAAQFAAAGLQPAGEAGSYFQETERQYFVITSTPSLALLGEDGNARPWTWRQDFNVAYYPSRVAGRGEGEVVFVGVGPMPATASDFYRSLQALPLEGKIILVPDLQTYDLLRRQCRIAGALVISSDASEIEAMSLGSARTTDYWLDPARYGSGRFTPIHPVLVVRPQVAATLVEGSGFPLSVLEQQASQLQAEQTLLQPLGKRVSMEVRGQIQQVHARNVLAYLPGGTGTGGADSVPGAQKMDDQMIILMAPYDGPGDGPDGPPFPGAQESAAGPATLIELARSWSQADYRPKRTFLFAAYVGQGEDFNHSYRQRPTPGQLLEAKRGFQGAYEIWGVFDLSRLGDAQGKRLLVDTGSVRLGNLLLRSARRMGVKAARVESVLDLEAIQGEAEGRFQPGEQRDDRKYVQARVSWQGGPPVWGTAQDNLERMSAESLNKAGRAISLALMVLGREWSY